MKSIMVHRDGEPIYPIVLTDSYEQLIPSLSFMNLAEKRICIVTDSTVEGLYLPKVKSILEGICKKCVSFTIPAGEQYKTLDTVRTLYEHLIKEAFDRNDVLVALGGGVTGDLTGFAAATYLRGIDFIQMPTTLLSQVDSSIGGKTGVDFACYKNMVGAFYMPKLVYINVDVLKSLPASQFTSGMGEVVKHGFIRSEEYYQFLKDNKEAIRNRESDVMIQVVEGSCNIKRCVVEEDPTEKGIRGILNFGHTLGHAIEKEMNFSLSHGACVGVGCAGASWLSMKRGLISEEVYQEILAFLQYFELPVTIPALSLENVMEAVKHDKKMAQGKIKFILLHRIGDAFIDKTVTFDEMSEAFKTLIGE